MSTYAWKRPKFLDIPQVYHRFEVNKEGTIYKLRVQDLTEDRFEELWQLYKTYFYAEAHNMKTLNFLRDSISMKSEQIEFYDIVKQNVSLVVVVDDSSSKPQIVGAQILRVLSKNGDNLLKQEKDGESQRIYKEMREKVSADKDIFNELNVNHYAQVRGILIIPEFRGLQISRHLLHAGRNFGTLVDIRAIATVVSNEKIEAVLELSGAKKYQELDTKNGSEKLSSVGDIKMVQYIGKLI